MVKNEQGYFLPEMIVAFLILGVIVSFVWPVYQEIHQWSRQQHMEQESLQHLQEKIEYIKYSCHSTNIKKEQIRSRVSPSVIYNVEIKCLQIDQRLRSGVIQITWQRAEGKKFTKQLRNHFFQ